MKNKAIKTIHSIGIEEYQSYLNKYNNDFIGQVSKKIFSEKENFTINHLHNIVLWKVGRYPNFSQNAQEESDLINKIPTKSRKLDEVLTRKILQVLLSVRGVGLPMASTILRFRNPNIYQIIDQRAYRMLPEKYKETIELKIPHSKEKQIDLYIQYLKDLKKVCREYQIKFKDADIVLFEMDKKYNGNIVY